MNQPRVKLFFPLLVGALMLAEITCSLESSMIYVALSPLYAIYVDPISVGWLVTAFTLTSAASAATDGSDPARDRI